MFTAHHWRRLSAVLLCGVMLAIADSAISQLTEEEQQALDARLSVIYHGDPLNDEMVRGIYVLVSYSRNNFFIDSAGRYRGFEYDLLKGYERFLNQGKKNASDRKKLVFIPMPFQDILPALAEGRGDIAAAGFTTTDERLKKVDFTKPYLPGVDEIVVMHKDEPVIDSVEDLAGREVYILADSSWEEHLRSLNKRLIAKGLETVEYVANVNKYYAAYKFAFERQQRRLEQRKKGTQSAQ